VWDLVKLTQNYLKLLVTYVVEGTSSILIHCISGWDRTPLFVSLLRLSLWADGQIHTSLSPVEMAYLTLAYDWYLFG
ncbi:Myotubularin-related protein 14, partial [Araneus ventricosus]